MKLLGGWHLVFVYESLVIICILTYFPKRTGWVAWNMYGTDPSFSWINTTAQSAYLVFQFGMDCLLCM